MKILVQRALENCLAWRKRWRS